MPEHVATVAFAVLGMAGVIAGSVVACLGVLTPWLYPSNLLGMQDAAVRWLGWLPGMNHGNLRVETATATLLVFAVAAAMLAVSLALVPTL